LEESSTVIESNSANPAPLEMEAVSREVRCSAVNLSRP